MKRKILIILLAIVTVLCLVACEQTKDPIETPTLATPQNLAISQTGLITWDSVEHATGYVVTVGTTDYAVSENSYQVTNVSKSFTYSVIATAEGYNNSPSSETKTFTAKPTPTPDPVVIGIKGNSEVKSGKSITLTANVTGSDDTTVTWSVKEGADFATVSQDGVLTANTVDGDKTVVVVATSNADHSVKAEKVVNVLAKPALTQAMLDVFDSIDQIGFEGYVGIDLYVYDPVASADGRGKLYQTYTTVIKTAMDGTNWYTEYENGNTGITNALYYKNHEGNACQVGLSFMNDEQYFPMTNPDGSLTTWEDSGLYNNFKGLVVSDFAFDEETWRWNYVGHDQTFLKRVLLSANPYDFTPVSLSLIIGDGEVLGIQALAKDDLTLMEGYVAVQQLFVAINVGDETGEIPTIAKYSHEDIHDALGTAIQNMQNLTSYTLDMRQITYSVLASGVIEEGFVESVLPDDCYFRPYTVSYDRQSNEVITFTKNAEYGYHKLSDNFYNAYFTGEDGLTASRAYETTFDHAKPTFAFAPELFRSYYENEDTGEVTYYVEDLMCQVATTFYYGMGNDIALYGIFAQRGYTSSTESFTPYVKIKDGYITDAGFYFYLGYLYGVVELSYSDFNTATLPEGTTIDFETRQIPRNWEELVISYSEDSNSTTEDVEVNAWGYLNTYFGATETKVDATLTGNVISWTAVQNATCYLVTVNGKSFVTENTSFDASAQGIGEVKKYTVTAYDHNYAELVPCLTNCIGDTYGFGLTTLRFPTGSTKAINMIVFYYDVPLDIDYTISTSLDAIDVYLKQNGFAKHGNTYQKGDVCIDVVDSNLDLMVYVWSKAKE